MANVGDSVRKSIEDWTLGQHEFAMLHACNAVDGTARKMHPGLGNKARFTRILRDNYSILGPMGIPGINLVDTRWPVKIKASTAVGGLPDIADVIYTFHRCTHGHGDELPDGFALISNAAGPDGQTNMVATRGSVQLSDRVIFGMLAVAVFSPPNTDQTVPVGYHLMFAGTVLPIKEWWGRAADFAALSALHPLPSITIDFAHWMESAHQVKTVNQA
jgi:hypothetical protein